MLKYTIPGPPRTKKNNPRIAKLPNGRPFILPSKEYKQYESDAGAYLFPKPAQPLDGKLRVKCVFYLNKNLRSDLVNYEEAICDILVHHQIIADDRWQIVYSMDGSHCEVDRENPRCEIEIEEVNEEVKSNLRSSQTSEIKEAQNA